MTRSPLLQSLVTKLALHHGKYNLLRMREETKEELRFSWATCFHRIVLRHCNTPTVDTSYLAYSIALTFASMFPPTRRDTRCHLYTAAAMLAFKFLEEDDPRSQEFHKITSNITTSSSSGSSESGPIEYCKKRICGMEQRLMMAVDWRLGDIVLPMVLVYALLDTISMQHRTLTAQEKRAIATEVNKLFFFILQAPTRYSQVLLYPMQDIVAVLLTIILSQHWKATTRLEHTLLSVLLQLLHDEYSPSDEDGSNMQVLLNFVRALNTSRLQLHIVK